MSTKNALPDWQIDKTYREVWSTPPTGDRLARFARAIYALAAPTQAPMQPSNDKLWSLRTGYQLHTYQGAISFARAVLAIAAPTQAPMQPSALRPCGYVSVDGIARMCRKCGQVHADPIYATPAPTQAPAARMPLTDEQINEMFPWSGHQEDLLNFARAIEAAHGIGDQP